MKSLIIFFKWDYKKAYWDNAFFLIPEFIEEWFLDFFSKFKDNNINIYICRWEDTYLWNNYFSEGFLLNKETEKFSYIKNNIKANFILNRSDYFFENWFNNNFLIDFCKNKLNIPLLFPEYSVKTYYIENKNDIKKYLNNFNINDNKVIKPINVCNWNNVLITNNNNKLVKYNLFPCILQGFIDSSIWIPDIHKWLHDLRLIIMNWKIIHSHYTIPKEDSYISNARKWWIVNNIKLLDLPNNIKEVVKKVDSVFKNIRNRYYSIDIWFTNKGIKIFELNSSPWIRHRKHWTYRIHNNLYKMIINNI